MKKKLKFHIIIIISICLFLIVYNYYAEKEIKPQIITYDSARNYIYVPKANQGTSLGIVNAKHNELIENRNFEIKANEAFSETIAVVNQNNYSEDFLIIPIIDYENKPILLGGEKQHNIKITLNSQEIAFVPFSISKLKKGRHDFAFLIVQDPHNQDLAKEYRMSTTGSNLMSIRGTIKNNSNKHIFPNKYVKLNNNNNEQSLDGILLTKNKTLEPWLKQKNFNDKIIDFNINIGNLKDENKSFALISFIDWNQVSINNNFKIFFGDIYPRHFETIKGEIDKADIKKNSISNYTTLFIPYPFQDVDPLDPNFSIEASARVGLDNRNN